MNSRRVSADRLRDLSPNRRVNSTPQQRGRRDRLEVSPGTECQIVGEEGGTGNNTMMRIIHEMNTRIHRLSEQNNARQQQVLEELSATLKEQVRGIKRNSDMVEDRVKGEEPLTVKFGELALGGGEDNAHNILCWPVRKSWRMVNRDPAEYWVRGEAWPSKVEPNLAGRVFTDHLIPLPIADRTLSWMHNSANKMELRHFIHANSKAKRQRGQKIEVKAHESDELGGMSVEAYTNWSEAGSTREMVEGLLNYMAVLHMIRPWDFGGLVMLRVLHEVAFFGPSARTAKEQKELVKEFCEDVMQKNGRRAITGEHPLTYRQAMKRAQEVVAGKNGMSFNLQIKADPYQSYKELKEKGEKIKKLQEEVARLKKELKEKPRARKDGGYSREPEKRFQGKMGRKEEEKNLPKSFYEERMGTCRFFNEGDCRRTADDCNRGRHRCSAPVNGKMCGEEHARVDHRN